MNIFWFLITSAAQLLHTCHAVVWMDVIQQFVLIATLILFKLADENITHSALRSFCYILVFNRLMKLLIPHIICVKNDDYYCLRTLTCFICTWIALAVLSWECKQLFSLFDWTIPTEFWFPQCNNIWLSDTSHVYYFPQELLLYFIICSSFFLVPTIFFIHDIVDSTVGNIQNIWVQVLWVIIIRAVKLSP